MFILLIFLFSCNGSSSVQDDSSGEELVDNTPEPTLVTTEQPTVYRAIIDELRVREEPSTKARVIYKMGEGQRAEFLGEATEETLTVTLRGKPVTDNWRKVRVLDSNRKGNLEGWIFAGGIEDATIRYEEVAKGVFVQEFKDLPAGEAQEIVSIDLMARFIYSGTVTYGRTISGEYFRGGDFKVAGRLNRSLADEIPVDISVTYTGKYLDGKADGILERQLKGYENQNTARIMFQRGRCLWGEIKGEGEGVPYEYREENPGSCTFGYLDNGLEKI